MTRGNLPVDQGRIGADLEALANLTEAGRPWTRRSFTPLFLEGRGWLAARMKAAGLDTHVDAAGNLIGRRCGSEPGRGVIMVGSHSDTVPDGGRFDGVAGVVAALEVARALDAAGIALAHDLEVVDFLAEEVSAFGVSCIGSRAMTGQMPRDWLARQQGGRTLGAAMVEVGARPGALESRLDIVACLELHIEQGPILERSREAVGIVTAIAGITRVAIWVPGRPDHAGTTPMDSRDDALVSASRLVLDIHREASSRAQATEAHFTATVGEFTISPGAANVVPGAVEMLLDARASVRDEMETFLAWLENAAGNLGATVTVVSDSHPCPCSAALCEMLEGAAARLDLASRRMVSGAGHDTAWMSKVVPAAMIFVPCRDGRSHCPEEWAEIGDVSAGAAVLFETVLAIDRATPSPRAG